MWSFQKLFFTLCSALSCVCSAADLIHVFGYEGTGVQISCSYPEGYETYEKYLCRNDCADEDVLITTSQTNKPRHSIHDERTTRIFTTTISNLQSADAGTYWCGVTRNGKDLYTEVKLETKQDGCCSTVNNIQGNEGGSVTISCPYDSQSVDKLKFLCRGNRPSTCLQQAVITSSNTQNGRFRLSDDRKSTIFTVTISSLTLEDSGSYLCGAQRNSGFDDFSAVELEVKEWCCVTSKTIRETAGHEVTLQCPYPPNHRNNRKFLCKGSQRSNCTDVMKGQSRFLVHSDFSESFSVKITQLEAGDTGTYWCRSEPEWNVGNYTQFHLSVEEEQNAAKEKTLQALPTQDITAASRHQSSRAKTRLTTAPQVSKELIEGFPDAALYSLVAVFGGLLLVTVILVTVFKSKCRKVKEVGVAADGKKLDFVEAQEVCGGEDVYQNHDSMVMRSQQVASWQQHASCHFSDVDEDEADYENVTAAEDIYCNQDFQKYK
ncbi:polymeric immunoglobulin receptor-like isoform X2 [Gambusia affinis]|uniref:polymeric immunoglobulin receptor-like isoform X2 n=1 Tax=Gambusia affinis TaxID=33528 RepID=UPI001CDCC4DF|nr:polymeric immunoglobulin receptor-like isoform X2 [Gambusia affinis]